jgi:hypothetical protein
LLWCWYALPVSLWAGPVPGLLLPENFASRICAKAVVLSLGVHWVRETDASRVNLQPRLPVLPTWLKLDLLVDSWSHSTSLVQGLSCEVVSKFLVQGSATAVLRRWVVWVQISNFMIGLMFLNVVKRFGVSSVYTWGSQQCMWLQYPMLPRMHGRNKGLFIGRNWAGVEPHCINNTSVQISQGQQQLLWGQ